MLYLHVYIVKVHLATLARNKSYQKDKQLDNHLQA